MQMGVLSPRPLGWLGFHRSLVLWQPQDICVLKQKVCPLCKQRGQIVKEHVTVTARNVNFAAPEYLGSWIASFTKAWEWRLQSVLQSRVLHPLSSLTPGSGDLRVILCWQMFIEHLLHSRQEELPHSFILHFIFSRTVWNQPAALCLSVSNC